MLLVLLVYSLAHPLLLQQLYLPFRPSKLCLLMRQPLKQQPQLDSKLPQGRFILFGVIIQHEVQNPAQTPFMKPVHEVSAGSMAPLKILLLDHLLHLQSRHEPLHCRFGSPVILKAFTSENQEDGLGLVLLYSEGLLLFLHWQEGLLLALLLDLLSLQAEPQIHPVENQVDEIR